MAHHTDSEVDPAASSAVQPPFGEWPAHGLERVPACPLCGSAERSLLHAGLRDHAFRAAPGAWSLQQCTRCGCAYLDPRPSAATISLAYERYYTHREGASSPADSAFVRLRRRVADAYLNAKYGTSYPDAFPCGQHIARLFPRRCAYLDVSYARHLGEADGGNKRLLDVGCGNGMFLHFAAHLGWEGEGVDNDAAAVAAARAAGCRVMHGSLDQMTPGYRHITLSHVIEHVHEPLKLLRQCFEMLAPGGRLWLQTPNLRSLGHAVFGPAWRGLEPPRHLVLFDRATLAGALARAGFPEVEFRAHPCVTLYMWEQSRMIAAAIGRRAAGLCQKLLASAFGVHLAELHGALRAEESEFLTCIAFRPGREGRAGA